MCFMTWSKLQTRFQGITENIYAFGSPYICTCPVLFIPVHNRLYLSKWQVDESLYKPMQFSGWNVSQYVILSCNIPLLALLNVAIIHSTKTFYLPVSHWSLFMLSKHCFTWMLLLHCHLVHPFVYVNTGHHTGLDARPKYCQTHGFWWTHGR